MTAPDARTAVAIVGALVTAIATAFPGAHWVTAVSAIATALMVHLTAAAPAPAPESCWCGQPGCPSPPRTT